ncbi:hypothetical protein OAB20_00595 [Winogradskyella sp.]|nr:hypothetical protein [Winogradskyella sp.]MDC1504512.1 hypothetical protein [Winogradskyella sp.]
MKSLYIGLICFLLVSACKSENSKTVITPETTLKEIKIEPTIARKIANAHGFENWKNVKKVAFTLKVDRDKIKGSGRSWQWFPKKDSVVMMAGAQHIKFTRSNLDSVPPNADRNFINDKFWAFVPFQLVWDASATITTPKKAIAPISNDQLNMITILYPNQGGYTPGDAYDIFYDNAFLIKEWTFRKANATKPTLSTTFENYKDYNGIKIATDHKMKGGNWNLNFADVSITLQK